MVEETRGPVYAHEMPPDEIVQATETIGRWFAERNIDNWKIGSCASRTRFEALQAQFDEYALANQRKRERLAELENGEIPRLRGELARLRAVDVELRAEAVEQGALLDRLSGILTRTANALKGEPDELTLHSWHDLPEIAKSLRERFRAYEDEAVAYIDRLGDLVGQSEDEKLEDAIARVLDERETFRDNAIKAEEALANEQARGIHTCNPGCTRDGCVNRRLREELAATQARLARIIELDRLMREPDWHIESIREMQKEKNALQDSADDTALRDRLRAERERVLLFLKQDGWYDAPAYVAAAVRALDDKP